MMMILRWFFMFSIDKWRYRWESDNPCAWVTRGCMYLRRRILIAIVTFSDDNFEQSKECTFTKSKPNSCIYFVMRNDMIHQKAADYCFNIFNGAAVPIYYSLNEAYEVMNRYYWWAKSDPNVPRLRFGVYDIGIWPDYFKERNNASGVWFTHTNYNPIKHLKKDMDMQIWNRSFPESRTVFIRYDTFDDDNYPRFLPHGVRADQYLAINPKSNKWSYVRDDQHAPFICEVPRFPKAYCEEGWWLHMKSRSCFYLNTALMSFTESALKCREIGSNLASINDETENNMALKMIKAGGDGYETKKVWFGLRHEAPRSHTAQAPSNKKSPEYAIYFAENLGYNVDGTPVSTFTYFGPNQPDGLRDGTTENCFLFEQRGPDSDIPSDNMQWWNDYDCQIKGWSICRKMASTQPYL